MSNFIKFLFVSFVLPSIFFTQSASALLSDNGSSSSGACLSIGSNLTYGNRDSQAGGEVTKLQTFLHDNGYLTVNPTGFFGVQTRNAVKAFQSETLTGVQVSDIDNTIITSGADRQELATSGFVLNNTGYVGMYTRAKIAYASCSGNGNLSDNSTGNNVICTMDSKMCSDGVYVFRTGPNCAFQACPTGTTNQTSSTDILQGPSTCIVPTYDTSSVNNSSGAANGTCEITLTWPNLTQDTSKVIKWQSDGSNFWSGNITLADSSFASRTKTFILGQGNMTVVISSNDKNIATKVISGVCASGATRNISSSRCLPSTTGSVNPLQTSNTNTNVTTSPSAVIIRGKTASTDGKLVPLYCGNYTARDIQLTYSPDANGNIAFYSDVCKQKGVMVWAGCQAGFTPSIPALAVDDFNGKTITCSSPSSAVSVDGPFIQVTVLPSATVGSSYSTKLTSITMSSAGVFGISSPADVKVWSISSGSLPSGLTISSLGVISGTPSTNAVTSTFTAMVTVNGKTAVRDITINVNPAPVTVQSPAPVSTNQSIFSATNCVIPLNGNTCPSIITASNTTGLMLNLFNVTRGLEYTNAVWTSPTNGTISTKTWTGATIYGDSANYLTNGKNNIQLQKQDQSVLATATVWGACASGSSWNGAKCATTNVTTSSVGLVKGNTASSDGRVIPLYCGDYTNRNNSVGNNYTTYVPGPSGEVAFYSDSCKQKGGMVWVNCPTGLLASYASLAVDDFNGKTITCSPTATTYPAPVITSLVPSSGPVGTTVVINGTNLTTVGNNVYIDNILVDSLAGGTSVRGSFVIPTGLQPGVHQVKGLNSNCGSNSNCTSNLFPFTVTPSPVSAIIRGKTASTDGKLVPLYCGDYTNRDVKLTYSPDANGNIAFYSDVCKQKGVMVWAGCQAGFTPSIPALAVDDFNGKTITCSPTATTYPAPVITSLVPSSGPVGTTVVINGTNLTTVGNNVYIDNILVDSLAGGTSVRGSFVIPTGLQPGVHQVKGLNSNCGSNSNCTSNLFPFTVTSSSATQITTQPYVEVQRISQGTSVGSSYSVKWTSRNAAVVGWSCKAGPNGGYSGAGTFPDNQGNGVNGTVYGTYTDAMIGTSLCSWHATSTDGVGSPGVFLESFTVIPYTSLNQNFPTASITINGSHNVRLHANEANSKVWSSSGGTSWSSTYSFAQDTTPGASICSHTDSGPWSAKTVAGFMDNIADQNNVGCVATIIYTVTNSAGSTSDTLKVTTVAASQVLGASTSLTCTDIPRNLHRGAESQSVKNLQSFLVSKGLLSDTPTGFYGDKTVEAVKGYQATKGLPETGMVYDFTRQAIKADSCK